MARAKKIKIPKFKTQAEKLKYIKTVMGDINKQYGNNVLNFGSNVEKLERVPFGVPELDNLIGGGIVRGLFTTIWGQSGSGKTSLAYSLIAEAQKRDLICYYIALEPFDPKRAEMFGVDLSKLILGEFPQAEQALDSLIKFSREGLINVCILDSIQGLSPKGEQEEKSGKTRSLDKDTRALVARKLSQFFRIATDPVRKNNVAVLLIGQTRTDISGFFPIQTLSGGNCFDEKTRILTIDGYKGIDEVKVGNIIPTINFKKKKIELKPIKNKYIYDYKDKLIQFKNKYRKEFLFTPNHICLVKLFKDGKLNKHFYKNVLASKKRRTYAFPVCFSSGNKDYPISDNILKFLGWVLTDSSIYKADKNNIKKWKRFQNRIVIYQTKYSKRIEQILNLCNIKYKKTIRIRNEKRKEFKNAKPSTEFYIYNAKNIINKYKLSSDKILPKWLFKLSDRQAKILFNEMMLADGCQRKSGLYSYIIKGNLKWIEILQSFLITHNIPCSFIKKDKKQCWILLLQQCSYIGFDGKTQQKEINYKGRIWDIEVENNYHFIERNGQPIITHNSLKHYSKLLINIRKGQKADAPFDKVKEEYIDEEGFEKTRIIKKQIGFDCVLKINKTQVSGTKPELTEVHFPYYFKTGFKKEIIEEKEQITENISKPKKRGRPRKGE